MSEVCWHDVEQMAFKRWGRHRFHAFISSRQSGSEGRGLPVAEPPVAAAEAAEDGVDGVDGVAGTDETVGMVIDTAGVAALGTCCWLL